MIPKFLTYSPVRGQNSSPVEFPKCYLSILFNFSLALKNSVSDYTWGDTQWKKVGTYVPHIQNVWAAFLPFHYNDEFFSDVTIKMSCFLFNYDSRCNYENGSFSA